MSNRYGRGDSEMAIDVEEQVPKSWVHEPERAAAAKKEKIQRVLNTAELPGALGGLALMFVGRKLGRYNGRAISALGSTLLMSAVSRFAYRKTKGRLKDFLPASLAPIVNPRSAEVIP